METKPCTMLICILFLMVFETGCKSPSVHSTRPVYGAPADRAALAYGVPEQRTATYMAVSNNVTYRLHIIVTQDTRPATNIIDALSRTGYVLTGYYEISTKQSDGKLKVLGVPITGEVNTAGVPSNITIPSSHIGVPDMRYDCFFDKSLNLRLGTDDSPIMYLVK